MVGRTELWIAAFVVSQATSPITLGALIFAARQVHTILPGAQSSETQLMGDGQMGGCSPSVATTPVLGERVVPTLLIKPENTFGVQVEPTSSRSRKSSSIRKDRFA